MNVPWFRIYSGNESLLGEKEEDGLKVTLTSVYSSISLKLDSDTTDRLMQWLLRYYPPTPPPPKLRSIRDDGLATILPIRKKK